MLDKKETSFSRKPALLLPGADSRAHLPGEQVAQADVVFMVDTSGSMSDEIEAVKSSCSAFASKIMEVGAQVRLGLIGFDIGGHRKTENPSYKVFNLSRYTIGVWGLCSPEQFRANIQSLSMGLFGGGGCYLANQDTVDIFPHVVSTFGSDRGNARILVVISDEMGATDGLPAIIARLKAARIMAHMLGVPGRDRAHELLASQAGGRFWDITKCRGAHDFSDLLQLVAKTIAKDVTDLVSRR